MYAIFLLIVWTLFCLVGIYLLSDMQVPVYVGVFFVVLAFIILIGGALLK